MLSLPPYSFTLSFDFVKVYTIVRHVHAHIRLLVKCGIAACGMRKVKCGMECAESYCGTVGNMRNAESCPVGGRMRFNTGCRGGGGDRRVEQNIIS